MSYSVTDLLTDLGSVIHGTKTNKIPNVYGHISRAARQVLQDVDPKETQRILQLAQVFNSVFDYAAPADLKGDRIIDLRPQAGRDPSDIFTQGYSMDFDAWKNVSLANKLLTQWNTGIKTLRIEAPTLTAPIVITDTGTLTGWTASGGAQNLSLDTVNNPAGSGAIVFDLAAGQASGSIQTSTLSPVDLTGRVNIDTEFAWLYLPTGASITSINLKWGSDYTANYYNLTITTNQLGTAFVNGFNLIALPWASATKVGSPVVTAYDSVQLTIAYNSTLQTGVKFCNLTSNTGYIFEMQYYSKYMFRNPTTNVFQERVVDVTDNATIINLDTDSYNLLFNKTAYFVAQALQGADAAYDATFFGGDDGEGGEYGKCLKRYKALNPSEVIKKAESYYTMPSGRRYGNGSMGIFGNRTG